MVNQVEAIPIPTQIKSPNMRQCWQSGYQAALAGKQLADNPHYDAKFAKFSLAYSYFQYWNRGWQAALEAREMELQGVTNG